MKNFYLITSVLILSVGLAMADQGHEAANRIEAGSYVNTIRVTVSASATTSIIGTNNLRPDFTCRNNSAFTLWIGSNAANNTLYQVGFPVLSSETFKAGAYTGSIFGQGDGAAVDVRCWAGLSVLQP